MWALAAGAAAVVVEAVEAAGAASSAKAAGAMMKAAETIDNASLFMKYTPFVASKRIYLN